MAAEPSWGIRAASRIVATIDAAAGVLMGTMQALGDREAGKPKLPPLAGFRRASKAAAKGTKRSIAGLIGIVALLMLGALLFVPRPKSQPASPATVNHPARADLIARRCRAGAYRDFPEIEKAECVDRPGPASTPRGDGK